jgi:hypothetical protein
MNSACDFGSISGNCEKCQFRYSNWHDFSARRRKMECMNLPIKVSRFAATCVASPARARPARLRDSLPARPRQNLYFASAPNIFKILSLARYQN